MAVKHFSGFPEAKVATIALPELVFTELVPQIDDLAELQVTLLVLRRLAKMQSDAAPWVTLAELRADPAIQAAVSDATSAGLDTEVETKLAEALARTVQRGTLLTAERKRADGTVEHRYLANSPRGRAAVRAMRRGRDPARATKTVRPNIFTLYEQTIGPLTAILSEDLMEAEKTYPAAWIEEAFHEAASRNKRNWKYIHVILERWRTEGKDEVDRRDRQTDPRRYIEGEYEDLIKH